MISVDMTQLSYILTRCFSETNPLYYQVVLALKDSSRKYLLGNNSKIFFRARILSFGNSTELGSFQVIGELLNDS